MLPQIKILILFGFVSIGMGLNAQNDSLDYSNDSYGMNALYFSGQLGGAAAAGGFTRKYDRTAFTYGLEAGYKIHPTEYLYGYFRFSMTNLKSIDIRFSEPFEGQLIDYRQTTSSRLMDLSLGVRYDLKQFWYVIPYLKASIGMRNAYLLNTVTDLEFDEEVERFRTLSDWNYLTRLSAGLAIPVTNDVHIDLLFNYAISGSFDLYLPPFGERGVISNNDPLTYFEENKSTTDLWSLQVGITLYLL